MTEKASSIYRHPDYRLNCAQVLVYKWCEQNRISDLKVSDLMGLGSGRAPEGMCGALYAAQRIFSEDQTTQNVLKEKFANEFGSFGCDAIRSNKDIDCQTCIDYMDDAIAHLTAK
ncbi:hypothetical protein [Carboxylicivirga sp. N1Y90]|uniref:hypothetical protein n=1 Tax=Carboxylicivirga fragile TaxID=3417571 RepID=UPI003D3261D1|nr:hypothetical protein [Marinilabiliaceae bacterium N1Y90]